MNEVSLLQSLGQVSASQTAEIFRDFLRGHVREMICEVMAAEVTELCGLKHSPSTSDHYRAGSCPGRVLVEGEQEEVVRPRVRRKGEDGSSCEVELATYRLAKDPAQLQAQIIQAIVTGVSGRSMQDLKPKSPGVSRSSVSRLWESAGGKFVETLRGKDLSAVTWCGLMLDGIRLSSDQTAVVALGIDNKGNQRVLDFVLGSSENSEVSRELMGRIVKRGFRCDIACTWFFMAVTRYGWLFASLSPMRSCSDAWCTRSATSKGNYPSVTGVSCRVFSRVCGASKGSQPLGRYLANWRSS
jgi:transposase-like protein